METWKSVEIPSETESIRNVEESIIEALERGGFSDDDIFAVRLALDEALANAIKHGNRYDAKKIVTVKFRVTGSGATITVSDEGRGFDYNHQPDPTSPDRLELPTGRGLLLMRSYMDSVGFNEKGNEVTMVKKRKVSECVR
ncbi:MAG: ATP-binding protein [Planctomycetota bacterium]|jgi:serine/threonine-protein kinase RsbW